MLAADHEGLILLGDCVRTKDQFGRLTCSGRLKGAHTGCCAPLKLCTPKGVMCNADSDHDPYRQKTLNMRKVPDLYDSGSSHRPPLISTDSGSSQMAHNICFRHESMCSRSHIR